MHDGHFLLGNGSEIPLEEPLEEAGPRGYGRPDLRARAPSAPPQEVGDFEFEGARADGLRSEWSERAAPSSLHTLRENLEEMSRQVGRLSLSDKFAFACIFVVRAQSGSVITPIYSKGGLLSRDVTQDTIQAESRRREASRAATQAIMAEQRRMNWHVRSSHGASWGPWENE